MAKGKLKNKIQNVADKIGDKLQKDADDIASIEVPEVEAAPAPKAKAAPKSEEPKERTWKIRA